MMYIKRCNLLKGATAVPALTIAALANPKEVEAAIASATDPQSPPLWIG